MVDALVTVSSNGKTGLTGGELVLLARPVISAIKNNVRVKRDVIRRRRESTPSMIVFLRS